MRHALSRSVDRSIFFSSVVCRVLRLSESLRGAISTTPVSYCIFIILGPALSVVVHKSGVQRDRNLWSCDDRKGYSPEDQHF